MFRSLVPRGDGILVARSIPVAIRQAAAEVCALTRAMRTVGPGEAETLIRSGLHHWLPNRRITKSVRPHRRVQALATVWVGPSGPQTTITKSAAVAPASRFPVLLPRSGPCLRRVGEASGASPPSPLIVASAQLPCPMPAQHRLIVSPKWQARSQWVRRPSLCLWAPLRTGEVSPSPPACIRRFSLLSNLGGGRGGGGGPGMNTTCSASPQEQDARHIKGSKRNGGREVGLETTIAGTATRPEGVMRRQARAFFFLYFLSLLTLLLASPTVVNNWRRRAGPKRRRSAFFARRKEAPERD